MIVNFSDLSNDALQLLLRLFGDGEPSIRWLIQQLESERSARGEDRHLDTVVAPEQDLESFHYHLRHAGAALEMRAPELQNERDARACYEASNFLAALLAQDLAMELPVSRGKLSN